MTWQCGVLSLDSVTGEGNYFHYIALLLPPQTWNTYLCYRNRFIHARMLCVHKKRNGLRYVCPECTPHFSLVSQV